MRRTTYKANHVVMAFDADSYGAAVEYATRKCHQLYPTTDGWSDHMVCVATTVKKADGGSMTKDTPLDVAICPSCTRTITRAQMAAAGRSSYACMCGYEFNGAPYRPYTIAEIIIEGKRGAEYMNVNLEAYTHAVIAQMNCAIRTYHRAFQMDEHEMPVNQRLWAQLEKLKEVTV